jgi:uncharacterized protein YprB with RNaseH-like and TPR domain
VATIKKPHNLREALQIIETQQEKILDLEDEKDKLSDLVERAKWRGVHRVSVDNIVGWRVGVWDLETSGLYANFGRILCGSVKAFGGEIKTFRIDESPNYKNQPANDKWISSEIKNELEKYHFMIGYNSSRFDVPFLNSRLIRHKLKILSPLLKHIDPIYASRYRLRLPNNTLAALAQHVQAKNKKMQLDAEIWGEATVGDKKALDLLVKRNIQDVIVLEDIFENLLPFFEISWKLIR